MKINGSTLKWLAMASMIIDHLAAVVLMPAFGIFTALTLKEAWILGNEATLCYGMRQIGRLALPIFCFLLVEGMTHTHSRASYLRNLVMLAIVSEIPYNLCRSGSLIDLSEQSTIWTLVIGFLTCCAFDWLDGKGAQQSLAAKKAGIVGAAMLLAWVLNTDYEAFGVAFIVLLYLLRDSRTEQCLIGAIVCLFGEAMAALAFVPIYFYNGTRGKQPKWFFYAFYPTHLLVLYFTRLWLIGW